MKSIFVKFCGITLLDDALCAADCGADAVGFITYAESKRFINLARIEKIITVLDSRYSKLQRVGVFVNSNLTQIITGVNVGLNAAQLHGDEEKIFIDELNSKKSKYNFETWKVLRDIKKSELEAQNRFNVDKFLIDSFNKINYGGTGNICDWNLASKAVETLKKPLILAGGLSLENIDEAISQVGPFGVDINSGIETKPGVKDHKKINQIMKALKFIDR